ncbi:hypothetical protein [Rhodoferax fermentans]|uniref:hypothetical protein n=1 Tax=Rhodoferax fermentans TaxID=28066 RepID=UPI0019046568|nr:hypothetical protein [Rhodoferax fermentans]
MTPEQKARVSIDTLLAAAGWHVCTVSSANLHAATGAAIREFPLNNGFGFADYCCHPLRSKTESSPKSAATCPSSAKSKPRLTPTSAHAALQQGSSAKTFGIQY